MTSHLPKPVAANATVLVSEAGVDALNAVFTFQVRGNVSLLLLSRVGEGTITDVEWAAGLLYKPGEGEADVLLRQLFPGIPTGNRLYARSTNAEVAGAITVSQS